MRGKISTPIKSLEGSYECVVIGSGYGGSACAKILAEAGLSVCLLERGKEWFPGDFPEKASSLAASVLNRFNKTGLFEINLNDTIDIVSGNGLGGTSLINAGVMIKPDDRVRSELWWLNNLSDEYFERALKTLNVSKHPQPPRKGVVFCDSFAGHPDLTTKGLVDIAVSFTDSDPYFKELGTAENKCNDCGNCVTGCNHGAKNTLDVTYLSIAAYHGAHLFTTMEVTLIEQIGKGYAVHYNNLSTRKSGIIHAHKVIVAAGVTGTFKILENSKRAGLPISDALGSKFSGNGDILGFGYNGKKLKEVRKGPTITSAALFYNDPDFRNWVAIEEGALPKAIFRLMQYGGSVLGLFGKKERGSFVSAVRRIGRRLRDILGFSSGGALDHSTVYLAVTFEESVGSLYLNDQGEVDVFWPKVSKNEFVQDVNKKMQYAAYADESSFIKNPRTLRIFGDNLVTVHPLGGCPMGSSKEEGVVDFYGRVFNCSNLYVADGSIFPTPLGVNPALTITAYAELIADNIVKDKKIR